MQRDTITLGVIIALGMIVFAVSVVALVIVLADGPRAFSLKDNSYEIRTTHAESRERANPTFVTPRSVGRSSIVELPARDAFEE